jgi:cbb3-type cytochrome oxidase subunit 3
MFKNYLHGIDGIATYPLFSLVVFFLFFLAVFIWSVKADKNVLNEVSRIPLDSDDASVSKS